MTRKFIYDCLATLSKKQQPQFGLWVCYQPRTTKVIFLSRKGDPPRRREQIILKSTFFWKKAGNPCTKIIRPNTKLVRPLMSPCRSGVTFLFNLTVGLYVHVYAYMNMYMHMYTHAYTYVCRYMNTSTYKYTHIHTYIYEGVLQYIDATIIILGFLAN